MSITFRDERTGLDLASYLGIGLTHGTWPWTLAANLCMAALIQPLRTGALASRGNFAAKLLNDLYMPQPSRPHQQAGAPTGREMVILSSEPAKLSGWGGRAPFLAIAPIAIAPLDMQLTAAVEAADRAGAEPDAVCTGCRNLIDSTVCHCGGPMEGHSMDDGHAPAPSGCDCLREP